MSKLDFDQYQDFAKSTAIYPSEYKLVYPALGLNGEAGEVAEKIKKYIRDGRLDAEEVIKELGDVLWYLSAVATDLGISLSEVAEKNYKKLKDRQERNAVKGSGDNR